MNSGERADRFERADRTVDAAGQYLERPGEELRDRRFHRRIGHERLTERPLEPVGVPSCRIAR